MPRSCWIDGSATFTTVLSSMIMNSPTATATRVHHLRFSGVNSRARISERLEHAPRPTSGGYPYASRVADFIWSPTAEDVESANLTRLARKLGVEGYEDLHRISIEEPERFWPALIEDLGLEFSEPWEQVVDTSRGDEWATWFTGGKLNLAWNCVHKWAAGELAEEQAAIWHGEDGSRMSLTWGELSDEVFRLAEGLASIGIGPGRRGRDLPADVAAGRNRIARLRASRRSAGADLLRLRSACDRRAARRREGEGADHGRRLASSRTGRADEADRGRGARIVTDGDAHGRLAPARAGRRPDDDRPRPLLGRAHREDLGGSAPEAGRLRASLPARVHVGNDRQAERSAARPGRVPRLDRTRGCVPDERQAG